MWAKRATRMVRPETGRGPSTLKSVVSISTVVKSEINDMATMIMMNDCTTVRAVNGDEAIQITAVMNAPMKA